MSSSHPTPILDYASPKRPRFAAFVLSLTPLILGLLAYAYLCQPAIHRRGYPPIDPLWMGVTYLWPVPIFLFAALTPPGRFSRLCLLLYALVTAYIDAATIVHIVPHRFEWSTPLFGCILLAPLHVAITFALSWITRRLRRVALPISLILLFLAAAFPFAYRRSALALDDYHGRRLADAAWADGSAFILGDVISDRTVNGIHFLSTFDPETGLPLRPDMHLGYEPAYRQRLSELLATHGLPPWSLKSRFIPDATLAAMLDSPDMQPVTTFPYTITPNLILERGPGTFSHFGVTVGTGQNLYIAARHGDDLGSGAGPTSDPAYIARLPQYPGIIFIRSAHRWVAACTDDGYILNYAVRDPP